MSNKEDCSPCVKGEIKKARHSGYDVQSSIFEFIDNAFDTQCTNISIHIKEKLDYGYKYLNKIIISDNNDYGISHQNIIKIFSWTFERDRDQQDIGEYGTGFKAASVNLGNTINVLTYDQRADKYFKAIADWEEMEETNRWNPKVLEVTREYYESYHPFQVGTSFIIENLRHEFFQNQKDPHHLIEKLYNDISYFYKYYLQAYPNKVIILKGLFRDHCKEKMLCGYDAQHFFYFFNSYKDIMESKILVYKDLAHFYNFFIHKKNNQKIELVEFVEKRKNGNSILRCNEISSRILASMTLVDEIVFRSCSYHHNPHDEDVIQSYGSVDVVQNFRIVGKGLNFRKPRHDPLATFIKHEIHFVSKKINSIMGIQFNKKSNIIDNDLHFSLEYLQSYHERELIRLSNKLSDTIQLDDVQGCIDDAQGCINNDAKGYIDDAQGCIDCDIRNIPIDSVQVEDRTTAVDEKECKRKNFSLETKLQIIKKQECRDSQFDFLLKDDVLPLDYDHKVDRTNNSEDNCQALSVISHAIKTRSPATFEKILLHKEEFIIQLLNCLTSSKYFLTMYRNQKIKILSADEITGSSGIFQL